MQSFRELVAWQKAMTLVISVYQHTKTFPDQERFALVSQLNRAAVSIPSNIAEGWARHTRKDFLNFVYNARGSLAELETQMELACRLGYVNPTSYRQLQSQTMELSKILTGLVKGLRINNTHTTSS